MSLSFSLRVLSFLFAFYPLLGSCSSPRTLSYHSFCLLPCILYLALSLPLSRYNCLYFWLFFEAINLFFLCSSMCLYGERVLVRESPSTLFISTFSLSAVKSRFKAPAYKAMPALKHPRLIFCGDFYIGCKASTFKAMSACINP